MKESNVEYCIKLEYLSVDGKVQCTAFGPGLYTSKEEAEKVALEWPDEIKIADKKGNIDWKVRRAVVTQNEVKEYYDFLREKGRKDLEGRM